MGSFTALPDLTTGDLVTEAWIDGVRSNLDYLLNPNNQATDTNSLLSTTGTVFADIAGASAVVTAHGGPLLATFTVYGASGVNGAPIFDLVADGVSQTSNSGVVQGGVNVAGVSYTRLVTGLASGVHTLKAQWKVVGSTHTGAMTGTRHFAAIEL